MSDEKLPRISRADFKKIRELTKKREKAVEAYNDWKEEVCDRDDVNCYVDQLNELTGKIVEDDARYNIRGLMVEGTARRIPKGLVKEAVKRDKAIKGILTEMVDLMDKLSEKYDTYPDLIDIQKGTVGKYDKAAEKTEGPVELGGGE